MKKMKPARRLACKNTLFEVFFDRVTDKVNHKVVENYLVVSPKRKHRNLVTGVAILPIVESHIALLRIFRHPVQEHTWEVPRGFVENGEGNVASIARELEEETGLVCKRKNIHSLGYILPEAGILAARIQLFVATSCESENAFSARETGHRELKLFKSSEIKKMAQRGIIQDPSTLVSYYRYTKL
jgi:ADP-ribose pyrophosphatase